MFFPRNQTSSEITKGSWSFGVTVLQMTPGVDSCSNLGTAYGTLKPFLPKTFLLLSASARAAVGTGSVAAGSRRWAALRAAAATQPSAGTENLAFR